jgi:hypothetical protein
MKQYRLTTTNPYFTMYLTYGTQIVNQPIDHHDSNDYWDLLNAAVMYATGERDTDGCKYEYTITDMTVNKSITYTAEELSNPDNPRCPWDCNRNGYGSWWRESAKLDAAEAFGVTVDEILYPYDEDHDVTDMMEAMRKGV